MPLPRTLLLLPLGFVCASLAGQDPEPKAGKQPASPIAETPTLKPTDIAIAEADPYCETQEPKFHHRNCHPSHLGHHSQARHSPIFFGAYVQGTMPLRKLKEDLDQRMGFGLGVQWTQDHGDWHASRTRMEWNTFPEGGSPAGILTYAKNYLLSWDHLFKLNKGKSQAYLVAGIGGSRWYLEQTTAGLRETRRTTKLAINGGAGIQIAECVNLEARYVVSSIDRTFDANTLQLSLGWRF